MIWFSFLRLSKIRVSIWALVVSSTMPCSYASGQPTSYLSAESAYLPRVGQFFDCAVQTLLQDHNFLILLFLDSVYVVTSAIQLNQQVVDLHLLGLTKVT
jgi:hypothetical protein